MKNNKKNSFFRAAFIAAAILAVGMVICAAAMSSSQPNHQRVAYVEFEKSLDAGDVDLIIHRNGDADMMYTLFNDETKDMDSTELSFYTYPNDEYYVTSWPDYDGFTHDVLLHGARVKDTGYPNMWGFSPSLFLMIAIIIGIPLIMHKGMGQGLASAAQSGNNAFISNTEDDGTRFSDIIGHDEIINDIMFASRMLKEPERGEEIGVLPPKGLLLAGPPGTGKTMIARAIANEAGVGFISANASSFIEMYVGVGAKRIREVFKEARAKAPCVLFIDEIDAVGGERSKDGRNSEDDKAVNALLQEMDGFSPLSGVLVIAATNAAESLDKALVRAGRFDRQISVGAPKSWETRRDLLLHYTEGMKVSSSLDLEAISRQTSGFTGADIKSVCNEAGMIAIMKDKNEVDEDCIEEAIDKKIFKGNRSAKKAAENDRRIVAYHEAGHAVMTYLCDLPIARASIIGTTSGVGGAVFQGDSETAFMTRDAMLSQVKICYAGRASEEIKFGTPTTGASNDITKATGLLQDFVERYGFDEDTGLIDIHTLKEHSVIPQDMTLDKIKKISKDVFEETKSMLNDRYGLVEALAAELLDKETMTGAEVTELLSAYE